ncbi:MAG: PAS domain S-box protein [Acidobacteria bacterium]|nr:PAS domain S-box protein [Acidobacteriota bacterium]
MHTFEETLAAATALMAGAMALVRHHTKRTVRFLLLGGGLVSAGLLDGFHALATAGFLADQAGQTGGTAAMWSALLSRIYLSALICASCFVRDSENEPGCPSTRRDGVVYALMAAGLAVSLLLLAAAPFSVPNFADFAIHRPAELIPGVLFALAALGVLKRGHWRLERFPHWLLASLLIAAAGHLACMAFSAQPFDARHVAGHIMRIVSYVVVLIGLLIDMSSIFRREEENASRLLAANGLLAAEITERQQAEESLLETQNELETRVAERTEDLMAANRALEEEISERRWAEAELCVQEERFRLAAQNASDVIWEWDIQADRISLWSDPAHRLGHDKSAFPQSMKDFQRVVHPDDRPAVLAAAGRFVETGEDFHQEYRIVTPGGEERYRSSRGTPIRDEHGRPSRCIGVTSDITERKHAEAAFAHMAAIVESSEAAIVSKSLDGTILTWNGAAERIFGYRAEEVKGGASPLLPPEFQQEEQELLDKVSRGECVQHMETVRVRKDGVPVNVVLAVSPVRESSGRITGGSWVVWDTTERKLLERQLVQAQKLESIGQLASGIAHEINTPIQYVGDNIRFFQESFAELERMLGALDQLLPAIRGGSPSARLAAEIELLSREADLEYLREEIPRSIAQSLEGVEHVSRIVGAMKEFSHPGPVEKRAVNLNRAIESTIQVSRNEWRYVATLETELEQDLPLVPCVQGEFNQVVLNLIINAAHAIADRVKERPEPPGRITVSTRRNGDWAELRVTDTGTGIPEAVQAKIFDPFFTTKPVGKGTGQGLAIAHSVVVQKHGGAISFETDQGAGTTFLVRLPLEQAT